MLSKQSLFNSFHGAIIVFLKRVSNEHINKEFQIGLFDRVLLIVVFHVADPILSSLSASVALQLHLVQVASDCLMLEEETLIAEGRPIQI